MKFQFNQAEKLVSFRILSHCANQVGISKDVRKMVSKVASKFRTNGEVDLSRKERGIFLGVVEPVLKSAKEMPAPKQSLIERIKSVFVKPKPKIQFQEVLSEVATRIRCGS